MRYLPSNGSIEAERGGSPLGTWRRPKANLGIRCVCETCNNGWMSRLENRVKPIVLGLIEDKLKLIASGTQSMLTLWAVKNAMVYENLYPKRPRFYQDDERYQLCIDNAIPHRTSVWLAKCIGHPGAFCKARDLSGPLPQAMGECHTYATTMAFGSLALQVVSSHLPATVPLDTKITNDLKPGPWNDATIRIWPASSQPRAWSPKVGLNGVLGLDEFSDRFLVGTDGPDPTRMAV
jgi:hypothetical protein